MKYRIIPFLFLLFTLLTVIGYSQSIIINELFNSGTNTDEWIELLVLQDGLDIRGWDIRDFSGSGTAQQPLVFSQNGNWQNLKSGTIIVISAGTALTEDFDPSDYSMTVRSNNTTYFSGTVFNLAGASDAVQIRNFTQAHIFGVSWGTNNASSLPDPKVHFTSGLPSGQSSISFNGSSVAELTSTSNWTFGNTSPTRGIGNTLSNTAWINLLRSRPEGSGSASLSPTVLSGNTNTSIIITYHRDISYDVNTLRIIVPSDFSWSKSISDIDFTNMTCNAFTSGDTIYFTGIIFAADSTQITIQNIKSPIYTGSYKIKVQSGVDGSYGDVAGVPSITVYGAAIPISDVKVNDATGLALKNGDLITVRGIITVGKEFGSPSNIQDNSGGLSIYNFNFSQSVKIGDEILVTAKVNQFNGLNQIGSSTEPPILHSIISTGNIVEPVIATPTIINNDGIGGVENYEGLLVRLNGVTVTELNGSPVSNWAYKNYRLTGSSPSDTVQIRIDDSTGIVGKVAPASKFDIIGVISQYKQVSPFIGGYQIMPRSTIDIISQGPIFAEYPEETDLSSTSLAVTWKTLNPGTSRIHYGKTTAYELGVVEIHQDTMQTEHYVPITSLSPATIYNVQAYSISGTDTSFAGNLIVSTTSAAPTTGQINVYFTKSINSSVSSGEVALGNFNVVSKIVEKINNAKRSIDVALYSLSGTAGGTVASALVSAKQRGVKVRVIGENQNSSTAPWSTLSSNGIPVIFDLYGSNDGTGLMHNKFIVVDYRGGAPESVWVWTGSCNFTDPGTNDDRQNVIEFQDVALAGAYTTEFEEMWGSNTSSPNSTTSRFSAYKLNNTPHKFLIGGVKVESYFSPSDRTEYHIGKTLGKAQNSINTAILTFTRKGLADTIIAKKNTGKKVRIVMDNNTDTGNQYSYLLSNGVDILLKGGSGLLHHKYAIVDAEPLGGVPYLITGSHNWSGSAETRNDENTIIVQDDRIANLYLQEFAARYYEAGGTNPIVLSMKEISNQIPTVYSLSQNYPNPFNPTTNFQFSIVNLQLVSLKIFNILGQEVTTLVNEFKQPGVYQVTWNAGGLSSGVYFYKLQAGSFTDVKKMILAR